MKIEDMPYFLKKKNTQKNPG